jgi:hypothetical protein
MEKRKDQIDIPNLYGTGIVTTGTGNYLTNFCPRYGVDVVGLSMKLVADVIVQKFVLISSKNK